jgi:hypothetical protein
MTTSVESLEQGHALWRFAIKQIDHPSRQGSLRLSTTQACMLLIHCTVS